MLNKRLFLLLSILFVLSYNESLYSQENDTISSSKKKAYIKTTNGDVQYFEAVKLSGYKVVGHIGTEKTIFKKSEVHSGCKMSNGKPQQFIIGKVKRKDGSLVFLPGKRFYILLVYDNGKMIIGEFYESSMSTTNQLSYNSSSSTHSSSGYKYYIVQNNEVEKIPLLRKNIEGWENIFTGCPEYKSIIDEFYQSQENDNVLTGVSVYWLISNLSDLYYQKMYSIF